jgi:uncharacterized membrane protein (DUF485 family)
MYLPCLYFIAIFLWMYLDNAGSTESPGMAQLLVALPFVIQLVLQKRFIDLLLGGLTLLLAYISDWMKISEYDQQAWQFVITGSVVVVLNFVMSFLFFRNAEKHVSFACRTFKEQAT